MKNATVALVLAASGLAFVPSARAVDVDAFVRKDHFEEVVISPTGEYFAAALPKGDRTGVVIMRLADRKVTASMQFGKNSHVAKIHWANPERVLLSMSEKLGALDEPQLTGELYALNVDGKRAENLVGYQVAGRGTGTRIQTKEAEAVYATLIDSLPANDKEVIIAVTHFDGGGYTRAERMDVYSGRRSVVARVPVQYADFTTDHAGVVRYAVGSLSDNVSKLYYRAGAEAEWQLVNDEARSGRVEIPLGFAADGATAYLRVKHHKGGPDSIEAVDVASGKRREVLRDDDTDPAGTIFHTNTSEPVGVWLLDGKPRTAFFDPKSADARLQRSLEAAFGGDTVQITSQTADGRLALLLVSSDRSPGDYYTFDTVAKKADHIMSRRSWLDPERMAPKTPVSLAARDGLKLHGFLTLPAGGGKGLPMVVLPHGGPFGVFDTWEFDDEVQLLASAGYAVLQVNYRGSGNHGLAFKVAGAREWGGKMQDDLTDATRWAIQQGVADAGRICMYGASYGAYASLVGVAREPGLYKCAVGYVGVYDLPMMHREDSGDAKWKSTWVNEWVGERDTLAAVSPNRMADRIKAPVFLAAGGEDFVAPIGHSKAMEKALRAAGVPTETLYFDTEGHGFYEEAHRREYYTRLLAFLARHIGGKPAGAASAPAAGAK